MPPRVLFLCNGNSARSQVAEAFLRMYAGDRFEAHNAGLKPPGVNPFTIQGLQEVGIDISGNTSKGVDTYLGKVLFQYLIIVCDDADKNCPTVWPGVNHRIHCSFEDPAAFQGTDGAKLEKFCQIRDLMENKIKDWLAKQDIKVQ